MIDAIEIIIQNGFHNQISAYIVYKNKVCYLNDKKYEVTDEFLNEVKSIIFTWKNEYGYTNNIDEEEFQVKVIASKQEDIYHGKGNYPNNYGRLKELLGGLNGR